MNTKKSNDMSIEHDKQRGGYYIVWEMPVAAAGETKKATLEDLRAAAHSGIDTLIDIKLKGISEEE